MNFDKDYFYNNIYKQNLIEELNIKKKSKPDEIEKLYIIEEEKYDEQNILPIFKKFMDKKLMHKKNEK